MNKITTLAIAVLIGGIIGYSLKNNATPPKPVTEEKTATETTPQKDSKEWKIQNAKSAAPDSISKDATVMDWPVKEGAELSSLLKGTNDWTCIPDYPASPGNDPICVDKQALTWFGAYMAKKKPQINQVGFAYMLQGGSDASNTDPFAQKPPAGKEWMNAPAHIMVFSPNKLDKNVYGIDEHGGKPWIMWADTPYEHLMVPVK